MTEQWQSNDRVVKLIIIYKLCKSYLIYNGYKILLKGDIDMEIEDLKKEIENIKERNKRVELDKKWETSWTRKICICILL